MTTQSSLLSRTVDDPTISLTGYFPCHVNSDVVDRVYQQFIEGTGVIPDLAPSAPHPQSSSLTSSKAIFLAVTAKPGGTETFAGLTDMSSDVHLAQEYLREDTRYRRNLKDPKDCSPADCAMFVQCELSELSRKIETMGPDERRGRIFKACGASDPRTQSSAGFDTRSVALGALGTLLAAGAGLLAYTSLGRYSDDQ